MFFTGVWSFVLVVFLVFEFWAITQAKDFMEEGQSRYRGTLSWHIWFLRKYWWGRFITMGTWGWAFYHFFLEPGGLLPRVYDDWILALGLGLVGAILVKPSKRKI